MKLKSENGAERLLVGTDKQGEPKLHGSKPKWSTRGTERKQPRTQFSSRYDRRESRRENKQKTSVKAQKPGNPYANPYTPKFANCIA